MEIINEGQQGEELLTQIETMLPDVVILACKPPFIDAVKLVRQIKQHSPRTAIVLLSEREDDELLFLAIKAGAAACFAKDIAPEKLTDAIRRVCQGEYLINESLLAKPEVADRILRQFQELPMLGYGVKSLLAPLSHRETEILHFVAQGNTNKNIARALSISEQTVKNHVTSILRKLVANDRTHAVVLALRQGLIKLE